MATILDEIVARIRADLPGIKAACSQEVLEAQLPSKAAPSFASALRGGRLRENPAMITELKKASPSKGIIREDFDVTELASELEAHGASALSVLTERHYFQGSPDYLQRVVQQVKIPVLRKDFIVDTYQIAEARVWGASAILLIAAALEPQEYAVLFRYAKMAGLDVLTEVHNAQELDWVLEQGADIVGVNSRNLKTFHVDLDVTQSLIGTIPESLIRVAESGVKSRASLKMMHTAGADAALIGEAVMAQPRPGRALSELLGQS